MSDLSKNHIAFTCSQDILQICEKILSFFQFSHFSYHRIYLDGSRIILSTAGDLIYDLYIKKQYFFRERVQDDIELIDLLPNRPIQFGFFGEFVRKIPEEYKKIREICQKQIEYESDRFDAFDRFSVCKKYKNYSESFIFHIKKGSDLNNLYINNFDIIDHFCFFFIEKAKKLIIESERNRVLKAWRNPEKINFILQEIDMKYPIKDMPINRYYLPGRSSYDIYLTEKEMICAELLMTGNTTKDIAKIMNISSRTAESYFQNIKNKLNCHYRSDLIKIIIKIKNFKICRYSDLIL